MSRSRIPAALGGLLTGLGWSCLAEVTDRTFRGPEDVGSRLAALRPVHLIGQSYDMADEGGRHGVPTGREIWRFLDVAKRTGAIGASLYLYTETKAPQWAALSHYPWK